MVASIVLLVLFSLGLAFQGAPQETILVCAFSIVLGSALPDIDMLLRPFWKYLRIFVLLMGAVLVAYTVLMAPTICFYLTFGACTLILPVIVTIFLLFLFLFDFINPTKPPFHSLITLAFSSTIYSILLSYTGFIELSFIATAAFASAYALHYFLELANVDRSKF